MAAVVLYVLILHTHAHILNLPTYLLKNAKECLGHCCNTFTLQIGPFLLVAFRDIVTLELRKCARDCTLLCCQLFVMPIKSPEYITKLRHKRLPSREDILFRPTKLLLSQTFDYIIVQLLAVIFSRHIVLVRPHLPSSLLHQNSEGIFGGRWRHRYTRCSTNFKYFPNSTASWSLILRGMDWNFPVWVGAMLQLTGESAYCSGRRKPSADSICPLLRGKLH